MVKQKGFYPYKYMNHFEKFNEELPGKKILYISFTGKKISDKDYDHVLKVLDRFKMKTINDYHHLHLTVIWVGYLGVRFKWGQVKLHPV